MSERDPVYEEARHYDDPEPDWDAPSRKDIQEDDEEIRAFRRHWHERQRGPRVDGYETVRTPKGER